MTTEMTSAGTILHGMKAIADFLGVNRRVAYHWAEARQIPTFKMGRSVCAMKASLIAAIRDREAAAQLPKAPTDGH